MYFVKSHCPSWEYSTISEIEETLRERCYRLLRDLRLSGANGIVYFLKNTRAAHGQYFKDLTPDGFPHYAGHYRGEDFECLRDHEVGIGGDKRVGMRAKFTPNRMEQFSHWVDESNKILTSGDNIWPPNISDENVFYYKVCAATAMHVEFLTIHPYINGNGHIARMLLAIFLLHFGIEMNGLSVDTRPQAPYTKLIAKYRDGERHHLENFILQHL